MSDQCRAVVYRLGPYRSAGRRHRFERERERHQCKRRAVVGCLCRQHSRVPGLMIWSPRHDQTFEFVGSNPPPPPGVPG